MNIIKHGRYYNKNSKAIYCDKCDCRVGIILDDVLLYKKPKKVKYCRSLYDGLYSYNIKYKYFIKCPECKEEIYISDDLYDELSKYKKCNNYKSDADKITEYLIYLYGAIHDRNNSLFNHGTAYKKAVRILRGDQNDNS